MIFIRSRVKLFEYGTKGFASTRETSLIYYCSHYIFLDERVSFRDQFMLYWNWRGKKETLHKHSLTFAWTILFRILSFIICKFQDQPLHIITKYYSTKNVGDCIILIILGVKSVIRPTVLLIQVKIVNYYSDQFKWTSAILNGKLSRNPSLICRSFFNQGKPTFILGVMTIGQQDCPQLRCLHTKRRTLEDNTGPHSKWLFS